MLVKGYVERHQIEFMLEQLSVKTVINQDPYTPFFILFWSLLESYEYDNSCILLIND